MATAETSFPGAGGDVCAACNRTEKEHGEKNGSNHWLKCFLCGEKSIDDCTGENWMQDTGVWSCGECRNVMIKMRGIVKDWEKANPVVKDASGAVAPEDKGRVAELENDVKHWRKKVAERNAEMREMQKSLRQMNERSNQLNDAETELRLLRQQIQQYQQQLSQSGMMGYNQAGWGQQPGMEAYPQQNTYKRPGSFDGPPSKRVMTGGRVLFVVDNFLRGLVMNQRIQVEMYRRKWDVVLRRGGSSEAILDAGLKAIQANTGEKYAHVVICGGAIDLEMCTRVDEAAAARYKTQLVRNIYQLAEEAAKHGAAVWIIAPPPRKQLPPWERAACIADLREGLRPLSDKCSMICMEESMTDEMFVGMKLYDGIHIKQDWEVPALELILAYMGLDGRIPFDDGFLKEEMFGYDVCWRCGGQHKRSVTPCREFSGCDRCADRNHHGDVCLFTCKMCMTCGERGHGPDKCKLKNERY